MAEEVLAPVVRLDEAEAPIPTPPALLWVVYFGHLRLANAKNAKQH